MFNIHLIFNDFLNVSTLSFCITFYFLFIGYLLLFDSLKFIFTVISFLFNALKSIIIMLLLFLKVVNYFPLFIISNTLIFRKIHFPMKIRFAAPTEFRVTPAIFIISIIRENFTSCGYRFTFTSCYISCSSYTHLIVLTSLRR